MTADNSKPNEDGPETDDIAELVRRFTHDVASPLTLMLALSELLLKTAPSGDRAHDDLTQIHTSAREVLTMARSLASRIPARRDQSGSTPGS